jgi:hypothetical protein
MQHKFRVFAGYAANDSAVWVYALTESDAIQAARVIACRRGDTEIQRYDGSTWETYAEAKFNVIISWETGEPLESN